jgi:hypothetical protein
MTERPPYAYKHDEVERQLDELNNRINNLQHLLHIKADEILTRYWDEVIKFKKQNGTKEGSVYGVMLRKKDENMVRMEWWESEYKWNQARRDKQTKNASGGSSEPGGSYPFLRKFIARKSDSPTYNMSAFRKAREWELPLIVEAEKQFGYIRAISKSLSEAKTRIRYGRTSTMVKLARISEEFDLCLLQPQKIKPKPSRKGSGLTETVS